MIIDHIGLAVRDYLTSLEFYSKALAPLRIEKIMEYEGWAGFGRDGKPEFWFGSHSDAQTPMHLAFSAENRSQVEEFYNAAIEAGATDNGKPGLRVEYHPHYYGAFVIDINGHNLEAVCHNPE
jgi:catechol 2,3-dioxygenase-like lactoylglutathione lyase family enzyme